MSATKRSIRRRLKPQLLSCPASANAQWVHSTTICSVMQSALSSCSKRPRPRMSCGETSALFLRQHFVVHSGRTTLRQHRAARSHERRTARSIGSRSRNTCRSDLVPRAAGCERQLSCEHDRKADCRSGRRDLGSNAEAGRRSDAAARLPRDAAIVGAVGPRSRGIAEIGRSADGEGSCSISRKQRRGAAHSDIFWNAVAIEIRKRRLAVFRQGLAKAQANDDAAARLTAH